MQLKLVRSQREAGVLSRNVVFCLDGRVEFTAPEFQSIQRYKLGDQVIYNSEASTRLLGRAAAQNDGSFSGGLKSLGSVALAGMKLNITIYSLSRGQHIECKSLDELLGAEEAVVTACRNLKSYLDTAMTFDGREVLIKFDEGGDATLVAQASSPAPVLVTSSPVSPGPAPAFTPPPSPAPTGGPAEADLPVVRALRRVRQFFFGAAHGFDIVLILLAALVVTFVVSAVTHLWPALILLVEALLAVMFRLGHPSRKT